jgi:Mce-associated membrane protein
VPDDTQVDAVPGSEPSVTAGPPLTPEPAEPVADTPVADTEPGRRRGRRRRAERAASGDSGDSSDAGRRPALPLVPVLAVLLVLIAAGCVALWVTRPDSSAVRTGDYVGALQAARSGIVDVTSFDYVTLDDDIQQIRDVTTGDLRDESVNQLDQSRQQITDAQAVVNTSVVGAAVGTADDDKATVFAVLQSTQQTSTSDQAQVQRYRVEISLTRVDGRWRLSGITGR